MNPANLIKMANQIGAFFEAMPNHEQAVKDVAAHIQKNWEPRMRSALLQHVVECGDVELSPMVREALVIVQKVSHG
jgi:formate dehydrogenase subunit delta